MTNNEFLDTIDIKQFKGITADSRRVKPGYIYIAVQGSNIDGDAFVGDALQRGASLVITRSDSSSIDGTRILGSPDTRITLARLAHKMYSPQPENIVCVTGTSGKTSTTFFYNQIAELLGRKSASIGTLGISSNFTQAEINASLTSPDPVTLNKMLHQLYLDDVTDVAIEASSHGIDQKRIEGIPFKAAAFTNFSQDHLDYHHDMESYFKAKLRLFSDYLEDGYAVLNADIVEYPEFLKVVKPEKIISYGHLGDTIKLLSVSQGTIKLQIGNESFSTAFVPQGLFQAHNLMAAIGLAMCTGMKTQAIVSIIPHIKAAVGRLELVADVNGAKIFIDYAHKPGALNQVLKTLKKECTGHLIVIFGCGGDRDKTKRPIMGEIAARYADKIIVTDDNPRTEDPAVIRKEILVGCKNAEECDDRATAIHHTIAKLKPNDILVIAGKGHETYQVIGTQEFHFSDHEEVIKALATLKAKR